jgi:hypothetical protein
MRPAGNGKRKTEDGFALPHSAELPRRIAILGFARSGRALAEALLSRGVAVAVGDSRAEDALPTLRPSASGARFFLRPPCPSSRRAPIGWRFAPAPPARPWVAARGIRSWRADRLAHR